MSRNDEIVILTAAYNDWESVFALLGLLDKELAANALTAKVVVVDDGSPTFADAAAFATLKLSVISEVIVLTLNRNMGNQRAVAIGVGYVAKEMPCDYLVIMDSDMEDRPEDVPLLIAAAEKSDHAIIFAERAKRSEGAVFKTFYGIYKFLYKMLTGMPISIGNFSAIPGYLIKRVASISEIWSHFPAGIMRARVPFATLSTTRGKRLYGQGKTNLVGLVIHGLSGLAVHADVVGVRIVMGILGLAGLIFVSIAVIILQKLFTDIHMLGWTSQIVILLGGILIQGFVAAMFIVFLVLAAKNQRQIIPAVDYKHFIMASERMYPAKKGLSKNDR